MYHYSTPELAAGVSNAGCLGALAPQNPKHLRESIIKVQQLTSNPFACNVFLFPPQLTSNQPKLPDPIRCLLNSYRRELGIPIDPTGPLHTQFDDSMLQLDVINDLKVPVIIFTFGIPSTSLIDKIRLENPDCVLVGSATSVEESISIANAGLDAVIIQGVEAGGHRTSSSLPSYGMIGLNALIPLVKQKVSIPVFAAGGITNQLQIKSALGLGANGVSIGTLFLTCTECKTPPRHRAWLTSEGTKETVVTRLFTGRPARMFKNRFYNEMQACVDRHAIKDCEIPWNLYARDVFAAASKQNRDDLFIIWAGQSAGLLGHGETKCASEIIKDLESAFNLE